MMIELGRGCLFGNAHPGPLPEEEGVKFLILASKISQQLGTYERVPSGTIIRAHRIFSIMRVGK